MQYSLFFKRKNEYFLVNHINADKRESPNYNLVNEDASTNMGVAVKE